MNTYNNFIFKDYLFDKGSHSLHLYYSVDGLFEFTETYEFDFDFVAYDPEILRRACEALFFMAGVSYYKAYLPLNIVVEKGELDTSMANFFSKTYQKGLGELFYLNKIDPKTKVTFPTTSARISAPKGLANDGMLVGIGGGKDSLVSVELLGDSQTELATWSVGHRPQLTPLIETIGLPHYWVDRQWDRSLLEHNVKGALNGHVPISAILACAGFVTAVLSGKRDIVVSNEYSANEPTLEYRGVSINHQYSKSSEFEKDFQTYLKHTVGHGVRYYSYLRPLSEVHIAEVFAKIGYDKYKDVFSSCNRAYTHQSDKMFWCGECAKCAFIFLALTPFIDKEKLEKIWGKNLFSDPSLKHTYKNLLGIVGDKPLDCVGEVKESRAAMHLAQKLYPELLKYKFELPSSYNYKSLESSSMPDAIYQQLLSTLKKVES